MSDPRCKHCEREFDVHKRVIVQTAKADGMDMGRDLAIKKVLEILENPPEIYKHSKAIVDNETGKGFITQGHMPDTLKWALDEIRKRFEVKDE